MTIHLLSDKDLFSFDEIPYCLNTAYIVACGKSVILKYARITPTEIHGNTIYVWAIEEYTTKPSGIEGLRVMGKVASLNFKSKNATDLIDAYWCPDCLDSLDEYTYKHRFA